MVKSQYLLSQKMLASKCLIVTIFIAPYCINWSFRFLLSTIFLCVLSKYFWNTTWTRNTGLLVDQRQLAICLTLGVFFFFFGSYLIPYQIAVKGGSFQRYDGWMWRISPMFQALNEEIVLRAMLLGSLMKLIKRDFYVSTMAALVFAGLHWLFYRYNLYHDPVNLMPIALVNLILFSFICNDLYFRSRHIGYGVALHAGWNLTRFGGSYRIGQEAVLEGQTFNFIEGSHWLTLFLISIFILARLPLFLQSRLQKCDT